MRNWLIKLRANLNMTQADVAEKSGMKRTSYASIEQGRRRPSIENAMRIAKVLGFEWTIFFEKEVREMTRNDSDNTKGVG